MNRREVVAVAGTLAFGAWWRRGTGLAAEASAKPVLQVDVPSPTQDKPQSKLWFAAGSWWSWLPTRAGNSIWRRNRDGWSRVDALDKFLNGLHGRADVWADEERVRAVMLTQGQLAVAGLRFESGRYEPDGAPLVWQLPKHVGAPPESATITRDGRNRFWVAYDHGARMWVRASLAADRWTEPLEIGGPASADDLCAITSMPGAVGVFWSDQKTQSFLFRRHLDGEPPDRWQEPETVARGGRVADDHINCAVAPDGTLYVATKNSVDRGNEPQLGLFVRRPNGTWESYPYAPLQRAARPTRPIAALGGEPLRLFLCHTVHRQSGSAIVGLDSEAARPLLDQPPRPLIDGPTIAVNDATSCKALLPRGQPWIVLASDSRGNVYEGVWPN